MGHNSANLLNEENLSKFSGVLLSPTNYTFSQTRAQIISCTIPFYDFIFDPQLYYPSSDRGELSTWEHFPSDVDTADQSNPSWWTQLVRNTIKVATDLGCSSCCSPCIVPRSPQNSFYQHCAEIADEMVSQSPSNLSILNTVVVNFSDIGTLERAEEIASIVSNCSARRIYLVFLTEVEPRRELADVASLVGCIRLIKFLERAGLQVLVGFSSTDVLLWKAAGASHCATGKFFNLRRFTPSRWEQQSKGGQNIPYWIEEQLMGYIRESDILRIQRAGIEVSNKTPYDDLIKQKIINGEAWLGESWRQYLYWFADIESRMHGGLLDPDSLLQRAENIVMILEDKKVLMEEPRNNFSWLRPWRTALAESD